MKLATIRSSLTYSQEDFLIFLTSQYNEKVLKHGFYPLLNKKEFCKENLV